MYAWAAVSITALNRLKKEGMCSTCREVAGSYTEATGQSECSTLSAWQVFKYMKITYIHNMEQPFIQTTSKDCTQKLHAFKACMGVRVISNTFIF
jgi:hypothetical protein